MVSSMAQAIGWNAAFADRSGRLSGARASEQVQHYEVERRSGRSLRSSSESRRCRRDAIVPDITDHHLDTRALDSSVAPTMGASSRRTTRSSCAVTTPSRHLGGRHLCRYGAPRPLPGDDTFLDRLRNAIDGGLDAVDVVLCTHLHERSRRWNVGRVTIVGCRRSRTLAIASPPPN
ncbi:MAG: hypothetical protein R2710_05550 [Acidimicrobiales bacterium]